MATWITITPKDLIKNKDMIFVYTGEGFAGSSYITIRIEDIINLILEDAGNDGLIPLEKRRGMTED